MATGNFDDRMSAAKGTYLINDTTEAVVKCDSFLVLEDTVIARIEINGVTGTDVKDDYISTPATAIKAGAFFSSHGSDQFTAITLTSGSVIVIKD